MKVNIPRLASIGRVWSQRGVQVGVNPACRGLGRVWSWRGVQVRSVGRSVRRGGHAWVDEVDEMMSRYFCRLVRDEMKMVHVVNVTPSLDPIKYGCICKFVVSLKL
jgi:hypothetical protein